MAYADQGMTGSKLAGIIFAVAINVALLLALVFGLTISKVVEELERVTVIDIEEEEPPEEIEEPPPPPDEPAAPPPPVAPAAPINLSPPSPIQTTTEIPPETPIVREITPAPPAPTPAPPPPPPSKARPPRPRNQARWNQRIINDYPTAALNRGEEGTVRISVTVDTNGRATNCQVTGSSGSRRLDRAACRSMERHSRFDEAWDRDGNPIPGPYSTSITYVLQ